MLGAIAGDIIGSVYEWNNIKTTNFPLFSADSKFTDDTVITIAVADCLLNNKNYSDTFRYYGRKYPDAGYGNNFYEWLMSRDNRPNNSFGNGSAMRVSPVGFLFEDIETVLAEAEGCTVVSHSHPEAIKGAQAVATAIFLGRKGKTKEEIKVFIENRFGYDLSRRLDDIRPDYEFDVTCQGSVPEAIIAFLESDNFEDAVRKAVSLGGDSDTIACITGGIAEAYYGNIDQTIIDETKKRLPPEFLAIVEQFYNKINM